MLCASASLFYKLSHYCIAVLTENCKYYTHTVLGFCKPYRRFTNDKEPGFYLMNQSTNLLYYTVEKETGDDCLSVFKSILTKLKFVKKCINTRKKTVCFQCVLHSFGLLNQIK